MSLIRFLNSYTDASTPNESRSQRAISGDSCVVDPDLHAARIGWSSRLRAKRRHAATSSGSKSGNSSRTCCCVRPAARRSRTSMTRMRIPRTQGRPPHWRGLTVIRFAMSAIGNILEKLSEMRSYAAASHAAIAAANPSTADNINVPDRCGSFDYSSSRPTTDRAVIAPCGTPTSASPSPSTRLNGISCSMTQRSPPIACRDCPQLRSRYPSRNSRTQPSPPFLVNTTSQTAMTSAVASAGQADKPTASITARSLMSSPT